MLASPFGGGGSSPAETRGFWMLVVTVQSSPSVWGSGSVDGAFVFYPWWGLDAILDERRLTAECRCKCPLQ